MELIVKITDHCDFGCTFCSSPLLSDDRKNVLDIQYIFDFLKRYPHTKTIIVNGGDPLMVPVSYYWEIINHLEENNYDACISFTTNLWNFYKNPDKWRDLFRHPRMYIATSFQYGDKRRLKNGQVYTESMFIDVAKKFREYVGYYPDFIAVIDEENVHKAVDTVRLARHLGVDCKVNYANASGDQKSSFPLSKIYDTYIQIWKAGLADWEFNTRQMANRLKGASTSCPLTRSCDEGIRVLQPDGKYYSCGSFGDDHSHAIDFDSEVKQGNFHTPLQDDKNLAFLKTECLSCPMFEICNGCRKHIKDLKAESRVEEHCVKMKTLADDIIAINDTSDIQIYNRPEPTRLTHD